MFINTRKYIPMFTEFEILDLLEQIQPEIISIPTEEILSFQSAMKLVLVGLLRSNRAGTRRSTS